MATDYKDKIRKLLALVESRKVLESHGRERKTSFDPTACYGPDAAGRCVGWGLARKLHAGF